MATLKQVEKHCLINQQADSFLPTDISQFTSRTGAPTPKVSAIMTNVKSLLSCIHQSHQAISRLPLKCQGHLDRYLGQAMAEEKTVNAQAEQDLAAIERAVEVQQKVLELQLE